MAYSPEIVASDFGRQGMHMACDGRLLSGVTVLMAAVAAGTIARAAEALGLSPSGVSRALARYKVIGALNRRILMNADARDPVRPPAVHLSTPRGIRQPPFV
jgi:Bacterial regulatory helix-turn-helix protein, lysR family